MNDTPDQDDVNRDGIRTLADMRRSSDDRIVAGVCAGVARHLNVDPIIIRIAVVALTFIGLAGLILYLAAWFLIASDDEPRSIAADWFGLDRNEEQVRTIGLFVALVLAVAAVVGDGGWGAWWIAWWILPAAFLYWLFAVRPRHKREATQIEAAAIEQALAATGTSGTGRWSSDPDVLKTQVEEYTAAKTAVIMERKRKRLERRRESRALRGLTLSVVLIAEAVTLIVDREVTNLPWTAYVAVALAAVAVGCLLGTVWGNAGGLIALGTILTIALLVGSLTPSAEVGEKRWAPRSASEVRSTYTHGVGRLELDMSGVRPATLAGHAVAVEAGVGQTVVVVPDGLPVRVAVNLGAGEVKIFGSQTHGRDNDVVITEGKNPRLNVDITQRIGDVEVIRR